MSPGRRFSRLRMMMPSATDPESSSAMMVSVSKSVFSFSQKIAPATSKLTPISAIVGSANPHQRPSATPVSAPCEIVSLKNAMRRAVTNTPRKAQSGPRQRAARKTRCMNGSSNISMVMMMIRRHMDAVGLLERFGVHDAFRRTLAADYAVEGIDPIRVAINHGKIVRNEHDREAALFMDVGNQIVEGL